MTTDIKERLRFNQEIDESFGLPSTLFKEAVDYIEQLEGQLSAAMSGWKQNVEELKTQLPAQTEQPSLSDGAKEVIIFVDRLRKVFAQRFPRCRDCADDGPECPNSGLPCEWPNVRALLAQRQDSDKDAMPVEKGVYAWASEYSAALVMVNKRPSLCSPGGVLNGHVMESTRFYDGCAVDQWTGGKWFGPLRAAIANGSVMAKDR